MKRMGWFFVVVCMLSMLSFAPGGAAQGRGKGHVVVPQSSVQQPGDVGVRAHTNLRILVPDAGHYSGTPQPSEFPPFLGFFFETPASAACVYRLVSTSTPGCNPDQTTVNPSGGSGAIAVVDAFDNPNAASDLEVFNTQFGLPAADFHVIYAGGSQPKQDPAGGWELEESLDVQWSHAMAPNAKLYLVEANSNGFVDLLTAVILAAELVASNGGGEVSMSWGGGEFLEETLFDVLFTQPGVVYVAATGDIAGTEWPGVSPNVVAAGGTTISRDPNTGAFLMENAWQDASGGLSLVEPRPAFQDRVRHQVGNARGVPDVSFDSNPNTGVWIYDSVPYLGQVLEWAVVGGTSVAAPSISGIINVAGRFAPSSQAENALIYDFLHYPLAYRDINYGNCGLNIGTFASNGWDACTGVGSPQGYAGK